MKRLAALYDTDDEQNTNLLNKNPDDMTKAELMEYYRQLGIQRMKNMTPQERAKALKKIEVSPFPTPLNPSLPSPLGDKLTKSKRIIEKEEQDVLRGSSSPKQVYQSQTFWCCQQTSHQY